MNRKRILTKKERGFILLAGSLMLMFTIPVAGLAIDAGFMYVVKARLAASVDAAALAAARQLSLGLTMDDQQAAAVSRAQAFFYANYPSSMFNTTNSTVNVAVAETAYRTRTVTVSGSVDAPLFFSRLATNTPTTVVGSVGKASRRDVNVMLVMDRSGSMNTNGGCAGIKTASKSFVDLFANQRDRLGLITFGISYALSYSPTMTFQSSSPTLKSTIDTISCSGGTGIAQALYKGYEQVVTLNEPGVLNVILLFTDGIPNTVSAQFPVNALDTARVAEASLPSTNKRSRCYDYEHARRYNYSGTGAQWGPSQNQVYRGAIYAQENIDSGDGVYGIYGTTTTNFTDAAIVTRPYASTAASATQYAASGYENDCWYRGGNGAGTGSSQLQYDIAYYPDTDMYGTALNGTMFPLAYYPVSRPYANKINVDDRTNMMNAALNAVDNMGARIRNNDLNPNINTVVYTICLGESNPNQQTLLRRVANDPQSPIYDPTKLTGLYVFAPSAADLNAAFVRIASEILRYAQ